MIISDAGRPNDRRTRPNTLARRCARQVHRRPDRYQARNGDRQEAVQERYAEQQPFYRRSQTTRLRPAPSTPSHAGARSFSCGPPSWRAQPGLAFHRRQARCFGRHASGSTSALGSGPPGGGHGRGTSRRPRDGHRNGAGGEHRSHNRSPGAGALRAGCDRRRASIGRISATSRVLRGRPAR